MASGWNDVGDLFQGLHFVKGWDTESSQGLPGGERKPSVSRGGAAGTGRASKLGFGRMLCSSAHSALDIDVACSEPYMIPEVVLRRLLRPSAGHRRAGSGFWERVYCCHN